MPSGLPVRVMPSGWKLILATHNFHKVQELSRMLAPAGIVLEPLPDHVRLPPEDGETFSENALGKARAAAAKTGRAAIADDSGIEADALAGRPGVRSARYAGADATDAQNLEKLIREVPPGSGLRYVCALAYVDPAEDQEHLFCGQCPGRMAVSPAGGRGFGYDPVFVPVELDGPRTMAELTEAEKDAISHRGRAAAKLVEALSGVRR